MPKKKPSPDKPKKAPEEKAEVVRFSVTLKHDSFKRLCLAAIEAKPLTKPHKMAEHILEEHLNKERKG